MPARNPRINVVLEKPLYEAVKHLARREGISMSLKVRDLLRGALDQEEDARLALLAGKREQTFDRSQALTHEEVWGRRRREVR